MCAKKASPLHPHDKARRLLFDHPELIEDLLRRHVAAPWVEELDLSTLERVTEISLSEDLKERRADAIWKVRWKNRSSSRSAPPEVYLLILLEFQSTPTRYMVLRLLDYTLRIWEALIRRKDWLPGRRLPPVFPVVLYNGRRPWRGPWSLDELIAPVPEGLAEYQPQARCFPLDERDLPIDLEGGRDLVAALAALDRGETSEELERIIERLLTWLELEEQKPLRRAFAGWIQSVLSTARPESEPEIRNVDDLLELKSMLHETVKEWPKQWLARGREEGREIGRREGRQEGRQMGRREGERELLAQLLTQKFGDLDEATRERLDRADLDTLQRWARHLLDASTLDEVWGETER